MDAIGRYRLERRLGAGSFATVWLARDDDLDVLVAVKVLGEQWVDNLDVRARFLAEARILRRIRDPRLIQVHDIGALRDGRPYFVMDFIDGGSLDEVRQTRPDPVRALRLCADACRALTVLHDHGIVHRDVTPANLLLGTASGGWARVLIADLGVARSTTDAVDTGMAAGTPGYMAPEQAVGLGSADHRADIYSLSAVTYAMLTGLPPFRVRSIAEILARPVDAAPVPIAERVGAPSSLDAVLQSGLAMDPGLRPPTARLLAEALDTIAGEISPPRVVEHPRSASSAPPPHRSLPVHSPVLEPVRAAPAA